MLTLIPPSPRRLIDVARETLAAGCRLYFNGRTLAAAPHRPGAGWHRVGVTIRRVA